MRTPTRNLHKESRLFKNYFYILIFFFILTPPLKFNIGLSDLTVILISVYFLITQQAKKQSFTILEKYILTFLYLVLLLSMIQVYFRQTFDIQYLKDTFSIFYFFTLLLILKFFGTPLHFNLIARLSLFVLSSTVVYDKLLNPNMRATGIFDNPNHTTSLIGVLLVFIILERSRINIKVIVVELFIGVIALFFTNGFGSIIALLGSVLYYSSKTSVKSKIPKFIFGVTAISLIGSIMLLFYLFRTRFQKSFKSRIEIWNNVIENLWESPFIPEKNYYFIVKDFFIYEAHNDILDFGLKYGIFGAIIFIIFYFALWINQDLNTKTILLYVILSGLTHSVFNYRWNWIFIAYFILNHRKEVDFKSVKY
jgi:hypothetical protein